MGLSASDMILIESQWNLNLRKSAYNVLSFNILIESQWNLNSVST